MSRVIFIASRCPDWNKTDEGQLHRRLAHSPGSRPDDEVDEPPRDRQDDRGLQRDCKRVDVQDDAPDSAFPVRVESRAATIANPTHTAASA